MHACITFTENRSGGKEVRHLGRSAELTLDAFATLARSLFSEETPETDSYLGIRSHFIRAINPISP